MSNNEQTITFPDGLKSLLTDFVVDVMRNRISSDRLSSYAAEYFSQKRSLSVSDDEDEQIGTFLSNQTSNTVQQSQENINEETQRRKSVWGGSPVENILSSLYFHSRIFRIQIEI